MNKNKEGTGKGTAVDGEQSTVGGRRSAVKRSPELNFFPCRSVKSKL